MGKKIVEEAPVQDPAISEQGACKACKKSPVRTFAIEADPMSDDLDFEICGTCAFKISYILRPTIADRIWDHTRVQAVLNA